MIMSETMNIFYFHLVITTKAYDVDNKVSPRTIDNKENFKLLSMRESDRTNYGYGVWTELRKFKKMRFIYLFRMVWISNT